MSGLKINIKKTTLLIALLLGSSVFCFAGEAQKTGASALNSYDTLRYVLIAVTALLVMVIWGLANVAGITAKLFIDKQKKETENSHAKPIFILLLLLSTGFGAFAQKTSIAGKAVVASPSLPWDIYLFFSVIALEALVIFFLVRMLYSFLDVKREKAIVAKRKVSLFQKFNKTVPLEEEHTLDLQHEYDGIRELDNNIPGWWKLAFFGTFIFGIVYLYRMFGSESMPGQLEELAIANNRAAVQKTEYLQQSANNIDENNVKMLGANDVVAGLDLYTKNCVACHGDKGQGSVGPNLTDEYWMHKGGLKDIFYSIKYGWQEKGMKSWKEDFSPNQIAQLTSFINSIRNTNVPGGKEKQGEIDTAAAEGEAQKSVSIK